MPRRNLRRFVYAPENVTFFVEEMIWYILRRNGIDLELRRPEHLEQLRAVAMYTFSPSIGDAVIFITDALKDDVMQEVNHVWHYIRTMRRAVRGEVLQSSLVIMGMRIVNRNRSAYNIFVVMAIVSQLCVLFCRQNLSELIGYAVSALEHIFNHVVRGGFLEALMSITTRSLRLRITYPEIDFNE